MPYDYSMEIREWLYCPFKYLFCQQFDSRRCPTNWKSSDVKESVSRLNGFKSKTGMATANIPVKFARMSFSSNVRYGRKAWLSSDRTPRTDILRTIKKTRERPCQRAKHFFLRNKTSPIVMKLNIEKWITLSFWFQNEWLAIVSENPKNKKTDTSNNITPLKAKYFVIRRLCLRCSNPIRIFHFIICRRIGTNKPKL